MNKEGQDFIWRAFNGDVQAVIDILKKKPETERVKLLSETRFVYYLAINATPPEIADLIDLIKAQTKPAQKRILDAPWTEKGLKDVGQAEAFEEIQADLTSSDKASHPDPKAQKPTEKQAPAP